MIQLSPLAKQCFAYNKDKPFANAFEDFDRQGELINTFNCVKAFYYRQKSVLIFAPQRKKIIKNLKQPPNLQGLISSPAYRMEIAECFDLGYCEARTYGVDLALSNPTFTHIMFVDSDVLLPLNAIVYLLTLNLPVVAINYYQKNVLNESTVFESVQDSLTIFHNQAISGENQNDLAPRLANTVHLGATLIDMDVFRKLPKPWFQFQHETHSDGSKMLLVGEDAYFTRLCMLNNIKTYVIPGMCALHCNLSDGKFYGPSWLVTSDNKIQPGLERFYTHFAVDPQRLFTPYDNDNAFGRANPNVKKA